MKGIGRPTDYDPSYCDLLVEHMAAGKTFESFGGVVCAGRPTLYGWLQRHPEFAAAKEIGFMRNLLFWENAGLDGLYRGGLMNPFNASIWKFHMKNQHKWKDSVALFSGDDEVEGLDFDFGDKDEGEKK